MRTIRVAGAAPYDVVVGSGALECLGGLLGEGPRRVAVIRPEQMQIPSLPTEASNLLDLPVPAGEAAKTVAVAADCWDKLGAAGFTRSDVVLTIGGGATTDLGGFVAATWLRGISVVHVPSTLLGMVDAAVGGKTGINTGAGKNLVGSFHEPDGVICDLALLATLPRAELVSGMAEVIKCGFVGDPEILRLVESDPADALDPTSPVLAELVERAVAFKAEVVSEDLREGDRREVLNYGHTMGHAIEAWSSYSVRHGEAVSLGMVYVAELARLAGRLDEETAARHASTLELVGLPTRWHGAPFADLLERMRVDKKARGSTIRFVVLAALGHVERLAGAPEELLESAYEALG